MRQKDLIDGRVTTGSGAAAGFTRLPWVREQLLVAAGIDPFPGTLNLRVEGDDALQQWRRWRDAMPIALLPPDGQWCKARAVAVRIAERVPGAVVVPEVPGYPEDRLEVLAPLSLRDTLALGDGDWIRIERSPPITVRAVLFDLDGTLVDSIEAHRLIAEAAAAPYGFVVTQAHIAEALSMSHDNFWELVVPPAHPERERLFELLHREAVRVAAPLLAAHARVFPGLAATIAALIARDLQLGIVTGSGGHALSLLERAGLKDHFGAIVTARDVRRRKPDPEGLLLCARRLGVEPRETVYIGDAVVDIQAARAAGMQAIAVLCGAGDGPSLARAGPDRIVVDHRHLPTLLA